MKRTMLLVVVSLLLAIIPAAPVAAASEIHVYPGDSIQAAVDSASPGDSIIVHAGEYHQSVIISTRDINLKSEEGAVLLGPPPPEPPLPPLFNPTFGIRLEAGVSNVTIEGFEIRDYNHGIQLNGASNSLLKKNELFSNTEGIGLDGANDNRVIENEVSNSIYAGISVESASGNLIEGNKVRSGRIVLLESNDNRVIRDTVDGSTKTSGITVAWSNDNLIEQNKLTDNDWGIELAYANDNQVIKNEVSGSINDDISIWSSTGNLIEGNEVNNGWMGIFLNGASGTLIKKNEVSNNGWGILLGTANDNEVIKNKVLDSSYYGISVWESKGIFSTGNLIEKNKVADSGLWDLYDSSVPPPLDNTWEKNKYETANS